MERKQQPKQRKNTNKPKKELSEKAREGKRRRNRNRRARKRLDAPDGAPVQLSKSSSKLGNNLPLTKKDNRATPRQRRVNLRAGPEQLKRLLGSNYPLYRFMMSPGEVPCPHGFPDAESQQSLVLNKIMDAYEIRRPSTFTKDAWSFVALQLASPEFAGLIMFYDGALSSDTEISWNVLTGATVPGWTFSVVPWPDITVATHHPQPVNAAVPTRKVNSLSYITPVDLDVETGHYVWPVVSTTNAPRIYSAYRALGMSTTLTPNVNFTQNQGILYTTQLNQKVEPSKYSSMIAAIATSTTAATEPVIVDTNVEARAFVLDDLPANLKELVAIKHYTGQFSDGAYVIGKSMKEPNYHSVNTTRSLLAYRPSGSDDAVRAVTSLSRVSSPDGSSSTDAYVPIATTIDQAFRVSIMAATNLAKDAVTNAKIVAGFEVTPAVEGPLIYASLEPPSDDPTFKSVLERSRGLIPPGAIADANDFWSTFKDIASAVWEVIKFAAPLLL